MLRKNYQLSDDVFSILGYPEKSYVSRPQYENIVTQALTQQPPALIEISGPSRTGKSALAEHCRRRVSARQVNLDGTFIKNVPQFWQQLAENLGLQVSDIVTTVNFGVDVGVATGSVTQEETFSLQVNTARIVAELTQQPTILTIDEFHWIPRDARSEIIRNLRRLMEQTISAGRALKVIVLLVPTREVYAPNITQELHERLIPVRLPLWSDKELIQIASRQARSAEAAALGLEDMAAECYGLPSIMQRYCRKYWREYHHGRIEFGQSIIIQPALLQPVLQAVANDLWDGSKAVYTELTSGPAVKNPTRIVLSDPTRIKRSGNLNQLILYSLTTDQFKNQQDIRVESQIEVDLDVLVNRLKQVVSEDFLPLITESVVEDTLKHMHTEAQKTYLERVKVESNPGDPILDYNDTSGVLAIYNPSFLVALRHSDQHLKQFRKVTTSSS